MAFSLIDDIGGKFQLSLCTKYSREIHFSRFSRSVVSSGGSTRSVVQSSASSRNKSNDMPEDRAYTDSQASIKDKEPQAGKRRVDELVDSSSSRKINLLKDLANFEPLYLTFSHIFSHQQCKKIQKISYPVVIVVKSSDFCC